MQIFDADRIARIASWPTVIAALRRGHEGAPATLGDMLIAPGERKMLVRSAWVPGVGAGVKAVTIYPDNPRRSPPLPSVQGQVLLFDAETGSVDAVLDGAPITAWKTAGDSALGADLLARHDVAVLLMVGAGAMAEPLIRAHLTVRPGLREVQVWNRSAARAAALAARLADLPQRVQVVADLERAVGAADIVCSATLSEQPLIHGAWLRPGTHLDLVGAYTPQMREADDAALIRSRVFVDSRDSTMAHIGEICIPLAAGVLTPTDILGDLYELVQGRCGRRDPDEITLYKNGGGAHLDIMVAQAVASA